MACSNLIISEQIDVYGTVASRIVESVLNGFNGTIFAYGEPGKLERCAPRLC